MGNRIRSAVSGRPAALAAVLAVAAAVVCACDRGPEPRRDWVIHSRVVFEGEPLPPDTFRLWFPFVTGDLYGAPTVADFARPTLQDDYRFTLDLNRGHEALVKSLEPTAFSVRQLAIEPAEARIARLAPQALEADGIEPVGRTQWIDARTREPLMLVYFDRPAAITGTLASPQRTVRYDIRVDAAGYAWVRESRSAEGDISYVVTGRPAEVLLSVAMKDGPPSPAGAP